MSETTILHSLDRWARERPDELAFTVDRTQRCTWAELNDDVRHLAGGLDELGIAHGEVVALSMATSLDLIGSILALQWIGAIPIVVDHAVPAATTASRLGRLGCRRILVGPPEQVGRYGGTGLDATRIAAVRATRRAGPAEPLARPGDVAYLQQTSGSTGEPQASFVSHQRVAAHVEAMFAVFEDDADVLVSWLPVYHDLGLVAFLFAPVHLALPAHLLRPNFRNLPVWLQTIDEVRGTFTAGPDFAYRAAAKLSADGLDLSSLKVALDGAEPVRQQTIDDFERNFGLAPVIWPGYGLGEAILAVTVCRPTERQVGAQGSSSCGRPIPGVEVAVRGEDGATRPSGEIGEIVVRSENLFGGYWNDPDATATVLVDGWLHTGDLGWLDSGGNLFVSGRKRAMIKRGGHLIPARAVEEVIDQVEGVRRSAALGVMGPEGAEELVVVIEHARSGPEPSVIERTSAQALKDALGFVPNRIVVAGRGVVPLTGNGKIRYGELREAHDAGLLGVVADRA